MNPTFSDRYRVVREIGHGGNAVVYLADDLKFQRRPVAIKVLKPEIAASIERDRFLGEIEIVARLNHPHILPLHDAGTAGNQFYYVMPFIAGGSLRARLERERRLPVDEALRITREIAGALAHAHGEGLVHRDIKPENVLLSNGIALVADFGLARTVERREGERRTTVGSVLGTPLYMAPEQAMGSAEVDARADLYSLGCVLYEMLAGEPPFQGSFDQLLYQHMSVVPAPVSDRRPDLPGGIAAALARVLAKHPSDRFATAAGFVEALSVAVTGIPTPAPAGQEASATPNNLPRRRTSFVGRVPELAECVRLLGESRLLTITGMGGCGKTRLATRLAEGLLESFPAGVWWCDLAPVSNEAGVARTVAVVMQVREEPGSAPVETLARHIGKDRVLLVLDNCEHLVAECAAFVDRLLDAAPHLRVLATSREGLGIGGEKLFALRPLDVPPASGYGDFRELEAAGAVRLFVDRARQLAREFTLTAANAPVVAEICRRLDGMPLAIELAAARVKMISVEQILSRLDDRFRLLTGGDKARHQTLRATIQWSHDLLSPEEQALFRLLAVFAGGWGFEAAVAVAGADEFEVLDLLTRLVDKSLVNVQRETGRDSRYTMLETVRQYAQEQLEASGEGDAARDRHLDHFLAVLERERAGLRVRAGSYPLTTHLLEQENILAAHAWCARAPGGAQKDLRLVGSCERGWLNLGLIQMGLRCAREALGRDGIDLHTPEGARALNTAAGLSYIRGSYADAVGHATKSLQIARALGDPSIIMESLDMLGASTYMSGDRAASLACVEELIREGRARDHGALINGLTALAELKRDESAHEEAAVLLREALAVAADLRLPTGLTHLNLATSLAAIGKPGEARVQLREALRIPHMGRLVLTYAVDYTAGIAAASEAWETAARFFGAAGSAYERLGARREPADARFIEPLMARVKETMGESGFKLRCSEGSTLGLDEAVAEIPKWLATMDPPGETGGPTLTADTRPRAS